MNDALGHKLYKGDLVVYSSRNTVRIGIVVAVLDKLQKIHIISAVQRSRTLEWRAWVNLKTVDPQRLVIVADIPARIRKVLTDAYEVLNENI